MSKTDLAVSHRQTVPKKYPRAGGGLSPCKQCPRIMIYYAPIAKAKGKQAKHGGGVPLAAVLLCFARGAVFGVLH